MTDRAFLMRVEFLVYLTRNNKDVTYLFLFLFLFIFGLHLWPPKKSSRNGLGIRGVYVNAFIAKVKVKWILYSI